MGYDTKFKGTLKFTMEPTAPMLAALSDIFGEDAREHPEWVEVGAAAGVPISPPGYKGGLLDLGYIDLKLTKKFDGIQWDNSTEKTYGLEHAVNLLVGLMRQQWPEFGLTGVLEAQGEERSDRWHLVMVEGVAQKQVIPRAGDLVGLAREFIEDCETLDEWPANWVMDFRDRFREVLKKA